MLVALLLFRFFVVSVVAVVFLWFRVVRCGAWFSICLLLNFHHFFVDTRTTPTEDNKMSLFARTFRMTVRRTPARRAFSDLIKERERAAEAAFFNKEDALALKALQAKLRASAASRPNDESVKEVVQTEIDQLRGIMAPHNLPEETLQGRFPHTPRYHN